MYSSAASMSPADEPARVHSQTRWEVFEETGLRVEVTGISGIYSGPKRVIAYNDGEVRQEFSLALHAPPAGGGATAEFRVTASLLSVILIRLAHLAGPRPGRTSESEAFRRFRQAVEDGFARAHRVGDYATQLGYSVRTLTRATRQAVGCGAKRYIDDRVLLEAKRLLVHTNLSSAEISELVGFPYPTVFNAFFRQRTATTPSEFRAVTLGRTTEEVPRGVGST